jgi:hypothetical protein
MHYLAKHRFETQDAITVHNLYLEMGLQIVSPFSLLCTYHHATPHETLVKEDTEDSTFFLNLKQLSLFSGDMTDEDFHSRWVDETIWRVAGTSEPEPIS